MTYALKAILLLGGIWLYFSSTSPTLKIGKLGMSIAAITSYFLIAGVAFWLDNMRRGSGTSARSGLC
jgi:hypothetical protein